jgi:hypothetical protein
MADSKITALASISTSTDPAVDPLVIVDVSDTSMAATGTTKKVTLNNLLSSSPTATGAFSVTGLVTAGSAAITGDLTVDTSTLKVDSTNNRVGIGTATPGAPLDIFTNNLADAILIRGNDNANVRIRMVNSGAGGEEFALSAGIPSASNSSFVIRSVTAASNRYVINQTGEHAWATNAGTAMTLNSTGLGIGVSPGSAIGNLQVGGSANASLYTQQGTDTVRMGVRASGRTGLLFDSSNATYTNRAWYLDNVGSSGSLIIGRQGLDVITFDNGGNVGVGVTPSAWSGIAGGAFETFAGATLYSYGTDNFNLTQNAFYNSVGGLSDKYIRNGAATRYYQASGSHQWFNAPSGTAGNAITFTQAMTLDANGRLLIGKTASALGTVGLEEAAGGYIQATVTSDASLFCNRLATDGETIKFYRQTLQVGNISVTTTATAYNTSSDYRLKESVQPLVGGLTRVNALKPSVYNWKSNGSAGEGFLAHELADIVPAAVTGEKDSVNADGSIKPQGVDMSRIVPILVAAIQELTAEVNALKNA